MEIWFKFIYPFKKKYAINKNANDFSLKSKILVRFQNYISEIITNMKNSNSL